LAPGKTVGLRFMTGRLDSPLDESMPWKALITTVAHHYAAQKYVCRVIGARPT